MRSVRWCVIVLLGLLWNPVTGEAHGPNASFSEITVTATRVDVVYLLSVEDIVAHFSTNIDKTDALTRESFADGIPAVLAFLRRHLILGTDDISIDLENGSYHPHADGTFIRFQFGRSLSRAPATVALAAQPAFFERLGPLHTNAIKVVVEGRSQQSVVTFGHPRATFTTGYRPRLSQCLSFVWLGVENTVLGYDHLVFLIGLLIIGGGVTQLVKVVLAFIVGHSATLALATLQGVVLPVRLVEGGIALTIAYVAFENFLGTPATYRWLLALCFGLVHGFGFSRVLRDMDLPESEQILTLISFNVGIEVALVAIVAVLVMATRWLVRQRFGSLAVAVASGLIFLFGVGWFIHRAFDLSLPAT